MLGEQPAALGTVTVLDTLSTAADPVLSRRAATHLGTLSPFVAEPLTVVAHCMDTALGCELAAALTAAGHGQLRMVLFAPAQADREILRGHAGELLGSLGLPSAEADAFLAGLWDGTVPTPEALRSTGSRLHALALAQAVEFELEAEEAEVFATELCERYQLWLGHLAGQVDHAVGAPGCPVDVIGDDPAAALAAATRIAAFGPARAHHAADPFDFAGPELRDLFHRILTLPAPGADATVRKA
ncbi:hypothetical protein GCM10009664_40140 [Kitasatospora gansuensis]